MTVLRHLCFAFLLVTFSGTSPAADPPYMWYATYSINDYDGNGSCGRGNLQRSHEGAAAFSAALEGMNLQNTMYKYQRKDTECTAGRWTGENAEVNMVDFVFYAGHGCGKGPVFGCNPGYAISNTDDIRFGGNGYLKWVQAASCSWFTEAEYDDCQSGLSPKVRWMPCLQGVHAIMGHKAKTWEYEYMEEAARQFWNDWCVNGLEIWEAWRNSQAEWIYENGGSIGIEPATLAPSERWGNEKFADAVDAPAPPPVCLDTVWLTRTRYGKPVY